MNKRLDIRVDYVQCHAIAGSDIYKCATDAATMALQENREVRFIHNNNVYSACPRALKGLVVATGTAKE